MSEPARYRERNATADRALVILDMFGEDRATITANEVANTLGVARSTAYRYVQSLVRSSFLEDAGSGRFRLGRRILELAALARRGVGPYEVARPVIRRLSAEVRETVLLTRLAGSAVICLDREEAVGQRVRISYERGQVLPLNAGASAFVLLAWLDEPTVDALLAQATLERFTARTLTTVDAVKARLASTAKRGYGLSQGELDENVLGVAAPIRDADGRVQAAISVAAMTSRVRRDRVAYLVDRVQCAAAEISDGLALLD